MKLNILSPERSLYSGEVNIVTLPGAMGLFTVLKDHAPLISSLKAGDIVFREDPSDKEKSVSVKGGFVEVKRNVISVCAE
jgi:F-type H+-transporting ATPase subunit epsilon